MRENIMQKLPFERVLLKTAFCIMACDGKIDDSEIQVIRKLCLESQALADIKFDIEFPLLISKLRTNMSEFIENYMFSLENNEFVEQQQFEVLQFAYETILADQDLHYSEIKLFKKIRSHLKISDDEIIQKYPELEGYLEPDIAEFKSGSFFGEFAVSDSVLNYKIPDIESKELFIDDKQD